MCGRIQRMQHSPEAYLCFAGGIHVSLRHVTATATGLPYTPPPAVFPTRTPSRHKRTSKRPASSSSPYLAGPGHSSRTAGQGGKWCSPGGGQAAAAAGVPWPAAAAVGAGALAAGSAPGIQRLDLSHNQVGLG
jgi:hypothetical protein